MKLAVSNIAWPKEQDAAAARVLTEHGVTGIEVAPTKIWPTPLAATAAEIPAYRAFWTDRGIEIVAAQALLFGRPELTLFDSADSRAHTLAYLEGIISLCAELGAGALVFGSPKNRRVGSLRREEAWDVAVDFFGHLGRIAAGSGTCVVIEANPPEYGADFVTRAGEAVDLVKAVNHPGFQLHLDTGCMTLANDPLRATFDIGMPFLRHVHVSEPNLDPPGSSGKVAHAAFADELRRRSYSGWVSLEMRESKPFTLDGLAAAVRWAKERYAANALPKTAVAG
ncbi:MAG: sugar phosphate isomerase/epimerase [Gemmataceae bacterium]|nr:sugar phosphate isomerase/epimerase [Gemmataceae bacterium]